MAFITEDVRSDGFPSRVAHGVASGFRVLARAMVINAEAEQRMNEVRRLQALSDEALAKKGLTRDRIVHHVFRDIYYP
ncbi:MAG: DUF1127 domain-containing protein [Silicimonas sp.]|jgi:uncharacterized protein YjiS (DUF1127 family)|nr:DUF1127 domain-containing protein [Silicimonas sp.]